MGRGGGRHKGRLTNVIRVQEEAGKVDGAKEEGAGRGNGNIADISRRTTTVCGVQAERGNERGCVKVVLVGVQVCVRGQDEKSSRRKHSAVRRWTE